jgi:hypothetical protein
MAWVSDSDSQIECSLEATQVSQPVYHGTQSSQFYDSQVEPRQKYCE